MYDIPEDCLLTYDLDYVDLHANSTDFEDPRNLKITPKSGNHSLFNKKALKQALQERTPENILVYNSQITKSSSKSLYETERIYNKTKQESDFHKGYRNRKSQDQKQNRKKQINNENDIGPKTLKRHKIIPSISSVLKKASNHLTSRTIIKQSKAENYSQTYHAVCEPRLNRRQQSYAVQPVYAVERNIYGQPPYHPAQKSNAQLTSQRTSRDEYFNTIYSLTSSSEADHELRHIVETKRKWTKHVDNNSIQNELDDGSFIRQHQKDQQIATKQSRRRRKFPLHVYSNAQQCSPGTSNNSDMSSSTSAVPSTCSGFWDYLFNKINNKYQKVQVYKSCKCCATEKIIKASPCCGTCNNNNRGNTLYKEKMPTPPVSLNTCACNATDSPMQVPSQQQMSSGTPPTAKLHIAPKSQRQNISAGDVHQSPLQPASGGTYGEKPLCQMGHNDLTNALNQKYNGEILCIHNPPCIVINGCLNLPPIDSQTRPTPMWAVTDSTKPSYHRMYKNKRSKKKNKNNQEDVSDKCNANGVVERSSQYHSHEFKNNADTSVELERNCKDHSCQYLPQTADQCQLTELVTEEKIVQSYCYHAPPCEVKRKCHKPKYFPFLNSHCYHVPMCENIPLCLLDSNDMLQLKSSCQHRPRCAEVPKCSVDYIVLNAKGETGTQVRQKAKMVCRHNPPCIMISKCLAQLCAEGYMPHDAIPSCVHRPRCEMIPACCRKSAKEMVSVCSQHPNSCRIV